MNDLSASANDPDSARGDFVVGLVQMSCGPDAERNRRVVLERVRQAAAQGAQIICLQELFASQYFCQSEDVRSFDLAEEIPGPSTDCCAALARELDVVLIVPVFEKRAAGLYHNTAAVIDAGGELLGLYRKMHIPDDPQYYEKFYFTPGDLGYRVFATRFGRVGVLICWDQWYPEAARLMTLHGAEIICCPSAIGWMPAESESESEIQHDAWLTIQRAHAIANGVYVATVNRVGLEQIAGQDLKFWGRSFICDPRGRVLVEASERDEILIATCSRALVEEQRRNWPFLRDRRIDTYGPLTSRFLDPVTESRDPAGQ